MYKIPWTGLARNLAVILGVTISTVIVLILVLTVCWCCHQQKKNDKVYAGNNNNHTFSSPIELVCAN